MDMGTPITTTITITPTITITITSTTDRALICAKLGPAGTTVLTDLAGTEPWKPVPLRRSGTGLTARVGLAGTRASLIAGDDIELRIQIGPGASLEITDIAALILHDTRGASAAMRTEIELGPGATMIWLGEPVIVTAGSRATRTLSAKLTEGARLLLGERVVLGRINEQPGALINRQRITQTGQVVLDECLNTADLDTVRSPIVAGHSARMLATLTMIGDRAANGTDVTQLHLEGSVWRAADAPHIASAAMASHADVWRRAIDAGQQSRGGILSAAERALDS